MTALSVLIAIGLGTLFPRPVTLEAAASDAGELQERTRRILVLANPIHTDIALPADPDVLEAFSFVSIAGLSLDYPGVFWVVFGWGGRSFYVETATWADLKPGPVINALTWDASVMHVRRAGDLAAEQENVRAVDLAPEDFDTLLEGIRNSFLSDASGVPRQIEGAAYDAHDIFFPANGGFNAFAGCNVWTARMLRIAGLRTGAWTPLPVTLDWSLELRN